MDDQMRLYYIPVYVYYVHSFIYVRVNECNTTSFDRPFDMSTKLTRNVCTLS